ncbi:FAD-binding and (Fe-S)-binding domain-containing protein [[Eubacterium] cellulosolvens]
MTKSQWVGMDMDQELIGQLKAIVGDENIIEDEIDCICYSRDMSVHQGIPDLVVFASNTEQVQNIMKFANEHKIPVTPRGSGTSVTGAIVAKYGGIVLDLHKMNEIKQIDKENGYAVIEPGVICGELNKDLAPTHFFPPDPGSSAICTVGGMCSTNASGLRALKYGTTKDHILGLEVVLADGRVIHTGTKAPKSSSGYDLTHLFINAEGTLGVITEITVKIAPVPDYTAIVSASFINLNHAGDAITEILTSGIELSAAEIMDKISLDVVKQAMNLDISPEVEAMVIMEVDGHKEAVLRQIEKIEDISKKHHGIKIKSTDNPKERMGLWAGRAGLVSALSRLKPGYRLIPIVEDIGVPITNIPKAIKGAQQIAADNDIIIANFGHVGDGNVHNTFVLDVRDKSEWDKVRKVSDELLELALSLDGTVTAEHGTGLAKAPFIGRELGPSLEVMRQIKKALDPNNILNPGKLGLDPSIKDIYENFAYKDLIEHPEKLESFGTEIDNEILACVQCGFCRIGCPTFGESHLESQNARGRVMLCYGILCGAIEPTAELAERLFKCTTCMNCSTVCPSKIKVVDVIEKVRQFLVKKGFALERHKQIEKNIAERHNPFGEDDGPREELKQLVEGKAEQGPGGAAE